MIRDDDEGDDPMTDTTDLDERERRLRADIEDARKSLVRARDLHERLCEELRAIRVERRDRERPAAPVERPERWFGVRINPGGHVEGSTWAGRFDTTEKVHKDFTPRVADRRRETAEGWRHEILTRAEWKARAEACVLGECGHDATAGEADRV